MKQHQLISVLLLFAFLAIMHPDARAQSEGKTNWFSQNVSIGQSMATAEQQALPAEFTITLPQHAPASYLINVGTNIDLSSLSSTKNITAFTAEFHRNTLTASQQNNLQLGFNGTWKLAEGPGMHTSYFLIYDPQYILDQVAKQHSFATDLLFTWRTKGSALNWDADNLSHDHKRFLKVSILTGSQFQEVFPSDTTTAKGLKIRPLIIGNAAYTFLKGKDITAPLVKIYTTYTQRVAAVNTTHDGEKYSHMFKAGVDYYLLAKPAKVSIGASFLNGSDYFTGLKQQQYFLISFNIIK
jgi:hypothetical protein